MQRQAKRRLAILNKVLYTCTQIYNYMNIYRQDYCLSILHFDQFHMFKHPIFHTEWPKISRKSVLRLLMYRFAVYLQMQNKFAVNFGTLSSNNDSAEVFVLTHKKWQDFVLCGDNICGELLEQKFWTETRGHLFHRKIISLSLFIIISLLYRKCNTSLSD